MKSPIMDQKRPQQILILWHSEAVLTRAVKPMIE